VRDKDKDKAEAPASSEQKVEVPKGVLNGSGLAPIISELKEKKRLELTSGEKIIYYVYNSANLLKDQTSSCILLTNRRVVKLEDSKVVSTMELIDLKKVEYAKNSMLRYDNLTLTPTRGKVVHFGIWKKEAGAFFAGLLTKVAQANEEESGDAKARSPDSKRGAAAKEALQKEIDAVVGADKDKGKEIARIMRTDDSKLSPAELKLKEDLKQEDDQLDILIGLMGQLEQQGIDIGKELDHQDKLLDHIGEGVDRGIGRVQKATGRAAQLAK